MVQTSVQFTPVQVLQAAKRAEAEGKMDYALQFYRHLVEQHGTTAEAQDAREGLFRIAEWRWGEARVARTREAGAQLAQTPPGPPPLQPQQQRVYNVANNPPAEGYRRSRRRPAPCRSRLAPAERRGRAAGVPRPLSPRHSLSLIR